MSARRFPVLGPVLVAAALLAWLPGTSWAQRHGGGGHGGGHAGGGFHSGGYHGGGFHSGGFHSGYSGRAFYGAGAYYGGRGYYGGGYRSYGRYYGRGFGYGLGAGLVGGYLLGSSGYASPDYSGPVVITAGYPPEDSEPSPVEPADYSVPPEGPEGVIGASLTVPYEAPVRVLVELPTPDAQVWFDGSQTQQTGVSRLFVSPPLTPGREYAYDVRARWSEDGRQFDQTRSIRVRAGNRVLVDFNRPAPVRPPLRFSQPSPAGAADEDIPPLPPKGPPVQP